MSSRQASDPLAPNAETNMATTDAAGTRVSSALEVDTSLDAEGSSAQRETAREIGALLSPGTLNPESGWSDSSSEEEEIAQDLFADFDSEMQPAEGVELELTRSESQYSTDIEADRPDWAIDDGRVLPVIGSPDIHPNGTIHLKGEGEVYRNDLKMYLTGRPQEKKRQHRVTKKSGPTLFKAESGESGLASRFRHERDVARKEREKALNDRRLQKIELGRCVDELEYQKSSLRKAKAVLEATKLDLTESRDDQSELYVKQEKQRKDLKQTRKELEDVKAQYTKASERIQELLQNDNGTLTDGAGAQERSEVQQLRSDYQALITTKDRIQDHVRRLVQEQKDLLQKQQELQDGNTDLFQIINDVNSAHDATQGRLNDVLAHEARLLEEVVRLEAVIEEQERKIKDLQAHVASMDTQANAAADQLKASEGARSKTDAEKNTLDTEKAGLTRMYDRLLQQSNRQTAADGTWERRRLAQLREDTPRPRVQSVRKRPAKKGSFHMDMNFEWGGCENLVWFFLFFMLPVLLCFLCSARVVELLK